MLVLSLLLCAIMLVAGMAFLSQRASESRWSQQALYALQARCLAEAGLEEARLKLGKCYDFPPTRLEQRQFTYSEDVAAAHGALPGSYTVTIDWRYAQAGEAYQVILVSSTGRLGPRHQVLAQRTLYAELDGAPTRSGPALNPKLFHWIEFRDEGSL
ncbi:MAG: hypothetical protein U0931_13985 [Vulcanimicrobiota bacterium]